MIATIAFLLLVSLVLTTVIDEIMHAFLGNSAGPAATAIGGIIVNNIVALAMATALFAAMFKILPDAEMRWKDMWVGAALTAGYFHSNQAAGRATQDPSGQQIT